MSNIEIGLFGLAGLLVLLLVRIPIAIALSAVAIVGIFFIRGERAVLSVIGQVPYDVSASWTLSAVPMFLLMGVFVQQSGIAATLFSSARVIVGSIPGGLAIATNLSAAMFSAVSGSTIATTAAMGRVAIPEMLKYNYDKKLATSSVAAAGTLGALIPPSIAFVIYGWISEQSVSKLLLAGIVPGVLTAIVYVTLIIVRVKLNPNLAPNPDRKFSLAEKTSAMVKIWPLPAIMVAVLFGIYTGITTPTEAGAVAALLTLALTVSRGEMNFGQFTNSLASAAKTTAMIFFIVIATAMFSRFLSLSGLPDAIADFARNSQMEPWEMFLFIIVLYLVLGMFLEGIGVMLISLPIVLPIVREAGFDLIWFGVIVVKFVEIGLLTPPIGMNAFVVKTIVGKQVELSQIFKGLTWFLLAEVVIVSILFAFPNLSLFLPNLLD